jgi:two-component system NtrC family sensor kinase
MAPRSGAGLRFRVVKTGQTGIHSRSCPASPGGLRGEGTRAGGVVVLFTRTIRRTMVCGLVIVLVMMILLSVSAIYSHFSYRQIIRELDYSFNKCPRKHDLTEAICRLKPPLKPVGADPLAAQDRQQRFQAALTNAQGEANDYLLKLQLLPPRSDYEQAKPIGLGMVAEIGNVLAQIRSDRVQSLGDPTLPDKALSKLRAQVDLLQGSAEDVPDFQAGIPAMLANASALFQKNFRLVSWSAGLAVLFFCCLIVYGYIWVFAPLRKLHQGALRVAQGDFNYRLSFTRQDEMKELAEAFNSMTARFQEIRGDLDRQVFERSKQLVRSERLAGIGLLAAGVAHEINNPLSAIAMAAESLAERFTEEPASSNRQEADVVQQYLEMIQREAFRCQKITQNLLDFARGNGDTCACHDLTAIINDVLRVVRHMSRYRDRTVRFTRNTPCLLEMNGPEIQQVVLNLVSNGLEAMDSGGTMTITVTEQTDHVTLIITDEGCGMTQQVIDNLFEPFFTQRRNGRGTGLGLSITHRIVTDHGGAIQVESSGPGRGSTFRVRLPRKALKSGTAA